MIDVSNHFNISELKTLSQLVRQKGSVQSRERLGELLWENGDFSDWVLDRILSRIRMKLRKVSISPDHLITVKKVGFLWR